MDTGTAIGIAGLAISLATGFGGVWLGWFLSKKTARDLAQDEREWTERHSIRERQDEEAARLDERLLEALADCPSEAGPARQNAEKIDQARSAMLRAYARGAVLDDPEILRRVKALDMVMLIASDDAQMAEREAASGGAKPTIDPWPISVGIYELRESISCFRRHVDPPRARLPTSTELVKVNSLGQVHDLLIPASGTGPVRLPWRPRRRSERRSGTRPVPPWRWARKGGPVRPWRDPRKGPESPKDY